MFSKVTTNLVVLPKFVTVTYKMGIVLFKVFNVKSMTGTHKITIIATFFFANGFLHSDYSRTESSEHCILRKCVQMGKTNQHGKTSQQKKNKKVGPVQKYGKQKNRRVVHIQKNTITKKSPCKKKPKKNQELQQQTTGRKTHMLLHSNQGAQGNRCNILMCVRTLQSATKRHDCLFTL